MVYLTDLADVLRTTGRPVIELDGWKGNYHSGLFDPQGNLWHHTGSYDAMADAPDDLSYAKWLAFVGRSDLAAPLCNVSISAEGVYYLCSSGRAYHGGTARASGPVPAGNANGLYIGWECMNSGSQGWGRAQYGAMVDGAAVTSKEYGWSADANRGHRETSVTGKWDPGRLDLDKFRNDIRNALEDEDMNPAQEKLLKQTHERVVVLSEEFDKFRKNVLNRDKNKKKRDAEFKRLLKDVPDEIVVAVINAADVADKEEQA